MQMPQGLDSGSFISLGLTIAVIAAFWRLSALLTEIRLDLKKLSKIPARLKNIENHLMLFEGDMNNLWGAARRAFGGETLEEIRTSRFRPIIDDE